MNVGKIKTEAFQIDLQSVVIFKQRFQNLTKSDFWNSRRKSVDISHIKTP